MYMTSGKETVRSAARGCRFVYTRRSIGVKEKMRCEHHQAPTIKNQKKQREKEAKMLSKSDREHAEREKKV